MSSAVLDVNVWASSFINPHGTPGLIRAMIKERRFEPCLSPEIFDNIREVLRRRHIAPLLKVPPEQVEAFLLLVSKTCVWVEGIVPLPVVPDDPDDDIIVATAVAAGADYIVTGDQHLLKLGVYKDIRIVTPREFVVILAPSP